METREQQLRELLEELLERLSMYNQGDMLEGYLNPLADEFNERLEALELPTIEEVEERD